MIVMQRKRKTNKQINHSCVEHQVVFYKDCTQVKYRRKGKARNVKDRDCMGCESYCESCKNWRNIEKGEMTDDFF